MGDTSCYLPPCCHALCLLQFGEVIEHHDDTHVLSLLIVED